MMGKSSPLKDKPNSGCCCCTPNLYADLPPDLRPKNKSWKTGFRQVTCPGCTLEYWTNMEGDLCMDCQKKRIQVSRQETPK